MQTARNKLAHMNTIPKPEEILSASPGRHLYIVALMATAETAVATSEFGDSELSRALLLEKRIGQLVQIARQQDPVPPLTTELSTLLTQTAGGIHKSLKYIDLYDEMCVDSTALESGRLLLAAIVDHGSNRDFQSIVTGGAEM